MKLKIKTLTQQEFTIEVENNETVNNTYYIYICMYFKKFIKFFKKDSKYKKKN